MRLTLCTFWACWVMLCWCPALAVGPALIGTPPAARYVPELDIVPQNFAIVQDSRGLIHVGNTNGVIEFDGERWALIPVDNREIVRSLAVDANDRVYVGGYNAFGYLVRDEFGQAHFFDLTPRFSEWISDAGFADIWDTLVTPEGVYFRALRDVFMWNPADDSVRHWRHEGRFGAIAQSAAGTLLQYRGEGFRVRRGDDFVALPGTEGLTELVFGLTPLADGGFLTSGVDGVWRRISQDGQVSDLEMPLGLPPSSDFYDTARLDDGSIALGGGDGMLYIVDPLRRGMQRFKLDSGFLSGIFPTGKRGFLVSADEAIYHVSWPTEWAVLGDEHGAHGTIASMASWAGSDYLISSAGVTRLIPHEGAPPQFEAVPWSQKLAYGLIEIDDKRALLAESHKLILVDHGRRREIGTGPIYPRNFLKSAFRPGRIYVGTESGVRIAELAGEDVDLSEPAASDLELGVVGIIELSDQALWFGTKRHGAWQLRLNVDGSIAEQRRYGPEQGLKLGPVASATLLLLQDGHLVASTHEGFFRWESGRFVVEDMGGLGAQRHEGELLTLAESPAGELWALGVGRLFRRSDSGRWRAQPISRLRRGAFSDAYFRPDGGVVMVASQSLLLLNGAELADETSHAQIQLRSVARTQSDGNIKPLPLAPAQPLHMAYGDFGLQFQFALPDLAFPRGRAYQGRLVGYESEFSNWSSARGYLYSRLSPGSYALEVRARDGAGNISFIPPYRLVIDPPWYQQWWAYVAWIGSCVLLLWWAILTVIRRRTRKLADETRRLESMIEERTRDLAGANERLELMANLDGLTGIANRRKLDHFLEEAWRQAGDRGERLALLAIDVDFFKRYNDSHGHLAGDQFLRDLMPVLSHCLRRNQDLLARYGGEEFVAVIPGADGATAMAVAERMRTEVIRADLGTSISLGVASVIPGQGDVSELIEAADAALYVAKKAGRNRVALDPATAA